MSIRLIHGFALDAPNVLDETRFAAETEGEYFNVAIDLVRELAGVTARMVREDLDASRNRGILRGLAVRMVKLLDRIVAECCEHHGEMPHLLGRPLLESLVNLGWLAEGVDERFDAFVADGMATPRLRRDAILRNIAARGSTLAIERRQLAAIADEAVLAGVDLDTPPRELPSLPALEQRARAVYGDGPYLFGYRMASGGVHGNWKDLISHHVDADTGFSPVLEWHDTEAQSLLTDVILAAIVLSKYANYLGVTEGFGAWFESILDRALIVHERYEGLYESRRHQETPA